MATLDYLSGTCFLGHPVFYLKLLLFPGLGDHNYCRDPDETGYPWCYTSQAGVRWEGCSVPLCAGGTGQLEEQGKSHIVRVEIIITCS